MSSLILPGNPLFDMTLGMALPPSPLSTEVCFVARAGSGILEPASPDQVREYLMGGEYDERLSEIDDSEESWVVGNQWDL
jgi:hypothetical protein